MEESDQQGESPSFWAFDSPHPLLRPHPRPSSNLLLRPWFIFIIAPIISLFLLILIPHLSSFLGGIVHLKHPNNVKKTWDTLNLLLVAFAIICGILSRSSNGGGSHTNSISNVEHSEDKLLQKSELSNQEDRQIPKWFDQYATDPTPLFNHVETAAAMSSSDSNSTRTATLGRLRNSSSYPDLRKQESWVSDDVDVSSRRQSNHRSRRRRSYGEKDLEDSGLKTIQVDTFTLHHPKISTNSPPQQASSSSSLSRSAQKARWEFQTLTQKEEKQHFKAQEIKKCRRAPPPPPPPPPPPTPPPSQRSEQKGGDGKRSSRGAKDIKSTLSFLYHQGKKKRQENKSRLSSHDASSIPSSLPASNPIPPPTPPPPPPPPPASVFHHIFSHKKSSSKSRRIHSIPVPPPPPPPPPKKPTTARGAPMPDGEEDLGSGSRSPLIPMPPPPPPPPFKMQALRFAVRGDFVRVQSGLSDSSDASDVIEIPSNDANANVNGNVRVFCPSPDVNKKAETFIETFWAGLKLENVNSLREKEQKMGSKTPDSAQADQEQK